MIAAGKARQKQEVELVNNSRNRIHQTWGSPFSQALYTVQGSDKRWAQVAWLLQAEQAEMVSNSRK